MTDYRGLPKEYTQVEYIESSGSQYINTGFVPNSNTRVVMDVMLVKQTVAAKAIFGARSASSGTDSGSFTFLSIETGAKTRSDYFGSSVTGNFPILGKRVVIDRDKNVCNVDGNVITNKTSANKCSVNMYLFAVNTANSAVLWSNLKLYSCQIYDNGTLKLDFVPAKRVSDNVIGMYDMVSKTFFTNAGTGVFTAGAEVKKPVAAYVGVPETVQLDVGNIGTYFVDTHENEIGSGWSGGNHFTSYINIINIEWKAKEDIDISFDYTMSSVNMIELGIYNIYINSEFIGVYDVGGGTDVSGTWTGKISKDGTLSIVATETNANVVSNVLPRAPEIMGGIHCDLSNIQVSTPSMPSIARKITNAYVGAPGSVQITKDNIGTYFDTPESVSVSWPSSSQCDIAWFNSNSYSMSAKNDMNISFDYSLYRRLDIESYKFYINSELITTFGADVVNGKWSGTLSKGTALVFSVESNTGGDIQSVEPFVEFSGPHCTLYNIQISTPSISSVARKIKKAYIGVPTQIPIYEERETTTTKDVETLITPSNISNFFTRAGNSYTFVGDSSGKFTSINQGAHSTTAKSTWTAKKQIKKLTFSYKVSSESNYDKYSITVGGTIVANNISGNGSNQTYSGSLSSGGAIVLQYSKDGSTSSYDDCGTIWDIKVTTAETVTTTEKVQVGTETKEVARLCYEAPPQ